MSNKTLSKQTVEYLQKESPTLLRFLQGLESGSDDFGGSLFGDITGVLNLEDSVKQLEAGLLETFQPIKTEEVVATFNDVTSSRAVDTVYHNTDAGVRKVQITIKLEA